MPLSSSQSIPYLSLFQIKLPRIAAYGPTMTYPEHQPVSALMMKRFSGWSLSGLLSPTELILGHSSWVTHGDMGGATKEAFVMVGGLTCGYINGP